LLVKLAHTSIQSKQRHQHQRMFLLQAYQARLTCVRGGHRKLRKDVRVPHLDVIPDGRPDLNGAAVPVKGRSKLRSAEIVGGTTAVGAAIGALITDESGGRSLWSKTETRNRLSVCGTRRPAMRTLKSRRGTRTAEARKAKSRHLAPVLLLRSWVLRINYRRGRSSSTSSSCSDMERPC
jgi:hypothetical protein